jgi:carboxyl-terminal processing protease
MRILTRLLAAALVATVLPLIGGARLPASAASTAGGDAVKIYHDCWRIIKEQYYDPSCNSQEWNRWEHKYGERITDASDSRKAIETMLASLGDRYTRYLHDSCFAEEREQIRERFCGVGIQIGMGRTGRVSVTAPIFGTPAARAGVRSGDEIVAINGSPVPSGMSVDQACNYIRGRRGTTIVLTVARGNMRISFPLRRAEINVHGVSDAVLLPDDIGYVRVSTLMGWDSTSCLRDALLKLKNASGIIIDLRDNPGGLLANALETSSLFLKEGIVVSTVDRSGAQSPMNAHEQSVTNQPIVLLVNEGTASAAEIVSAALQSNRRAQVIGQKTFGKGSVQSIFRLTDGGGINVTVAQYVSPGGVEIRKGITPDIEVEVTSVDRDNKKGPWFTYLFSSNWNSEFAPDTKNDVQLAKAMEVLQQEIASSVLLEPSPESLLRVGSVQKFSPGMLESICQRLLRLPGSLYNSARRRFVDILDGSA